MTKEQYEAIIGLLIDKIKEQEQKIALREWQIEDVKKQLAEAEYHLNPTPEKAQHLEIR